MSLGSKLAGDLELGLNEVLVQKPENDSPY
jgi:hypothetical protein